MKRILGNHMKRWKGADEIRLSGVVLDLVLTHRLPVGRLEIPCGPRDGTALRAGSSVLVVATEGQTLAGQALQPPPLDRLYLEKSAPTRGQ